MLTLIERGITMFRTSLLLLAMGCAPVAVEIPLDADQDGLLADVESELGTDPDNPDSDNDGYTDGEELDLGTDPTDGTDRPYLGGWPRDACADSISPTGNQVGEVTDNFELLDQYGDKIELHHFCDHVVLMVSSATWCPPCNSEAPVVEALYQQFKGRKVLPITLLGENENSQTPEVADLQAWADAHGVTHPIVADPGFAITSRFVDGGQIGLPTMHLVGVGAEVLERDTRLGTGDIEAQLQQLGR